MKFILRILSIFIVLILGIYVIFLSFFSTKNSIDIPDVDETFYSGILSTFKNASGSVNITNPLPGVVIQSSGNPLLSESGSDHNTLSDFDEEVSIFSIYNTLEDFTFSGSLYKAQIISPGDIYIDSRSEGGNIFLYSMSATVHIELYGKNGDKYTELTLFPHMYIEFNPQKAFLLKGADMLRVNSFYKLGYYDGIPKESNENYLLESYVGAESMYPTMISNILDIKQASHQFYEELMALELYDYPGKALLEKYRALFVNNTKKQKLDTNAYFSHIIRTLQSRYSFEEAQKKDTEYHEKLSHYSSENIVDFQQLRENILYNIFPDTQLESIASKQLFASLVSGDQSHLGNKYPYFAYSIFSENTQLYIEESVDIYSQYVFYIDGLSLTEDQKKIYYQYFSFFIEQQISHTLSKNKVEDLPLIARLLKHHIDLWEVSYNSDNTAIKTGVYVYGEILESLETYLRNNFFKLQRTQAGLLQVERHGISSTHISQLEIKIQDIYTLFQKNKGFLDPNDVRDVAINEKFVIVHKKMKEYLLALQNYQAYENEYDSLKKNILTIDTINTQKDSITWSEHAIRNYFSRFEGANILQSTITQNKNIFHIKNYKVYNNTFSFSVNPEDAYKIYDLVINGEEKSFQYKLAIIEENSKENASYQDPNSYNEGKNFERFFINLISQKDKDVEIYSKKDTKTSEDSAEIVFKKVKLLGKNGEFSSLKDILSIQYNDIILKRQASGYDILIEGTPVKLGGKAYKFDAEYVFSQQDHYFKNISLRSENYQLQIGVAGKIQIQDFAGVFKNLGSHIQSIEDTASLLGKQIYTPIEISYNSRSQKSTFKFESGSERYTIIQSGDEVLKLYKGIKNMISDPIFSSQIISYID